MPQLEIAHARAAGSGVGSGRQLHLARVVGSGTVATSPRLHVARASAAGTLSVVLNPLTNRADVEPLTTVQLTAVLASGLTADSYQWRRVSGDVATMVADGPLCQVTAPAGPPPNGATTVVGVRATLGGVQSPEVTSQISVRPHLRWWRNASSPNWAPIGRSTAATHPLEEDPGYDVIVPIIQSNMRGAATDYTTLDAAYPGGVFMWDHATSTIVPATEPQSNLDNHVSMGGSNTFIRAWSEQKLAAGRQVLIVNIARGGTGFTTPCSNPFNNQFHWRPDLPDDANNLARRGAEAIQAALAAAGPGSRVVAFLANHGSTDGTNNTPKATFKGYLQSWIPWLRTELGVPTVPYLMMQMRPDLVANETRHRIIDEAQRETAAELPNVGYAYSPVGSAYYKADAVHFNAAGMREIGTRLFAQYDAAAAG